MLRINIVVVSTSLLDTVPLTTTQENMNSWKAIICKCYIARKLNQNDLRVQYNYGFVIDKGSKDHFAPKCTTRKISKYQFVFFSVDGSLKKTKFRRSKKWLIHCKQFILVHLVESLVLVSRTCHFTQNLSKKISGHPCY